MKNFGEFNLCDLLAVLPLGRCATLSSPLYPRAVCLYVDNQSLLQVDVVYGQAARPGISLRLERVADREGVWALLDHAEARVATLVEPTLGYVYEWLGVKEASMAVTAEAVGLPDRFTANLGTSELLPFGSTEPTSNIAQASFFRQPDGAIYLRGWRDYTEVFQYPVKAGGAEGLTYGVTVAGSNWAVTDEVDRVVLRFDADSRDVTLAFMPEGTVVAPRYRLTTKNALANDRDRVIYFEPADDGGRVLVALDGQSLTYRGRCVLECPPPAEGGFALRWCHIRECYEVFADAHHYAHGIRARVAGEEPQNVADLVATQAEVAAVFAKPLPRYRLVAKHTGVSHEMVIRAYPDGTRWLYAYKSADDLSRLGRVVLGGDELPVGTVSLRWRAAVGRFDVVDSAGVFAELVATEAEVAPYFEDIPAKLKSVMVPCVPLHPVTAPIPSDRDVAIIVCEGGDRHVLQLWRNGEQDADFEVRLGDPTPGVCGVKPNVARPGYVVVNVLGTSFLDLLCTVGELDAAFAPGCLGRFRLVTEGERQATVVPLTSYCELDPFASQVAQCPNRATLIPDVMGRVWLRAYRHDECVFERVVTAAAELRWCKGPCATGLFNAKDQLLLLLDGSRELIDAAFHPVKSETKAEQLRAANEVIALEHVTPFRYFATLDETFTPYAPPPPSNPVPRNEGEYVAYARGQSDDEAYYWATYQAVNWALHRSRDRTWDAQHFADCRAAYVRRYGDVRGPWLAAAYEHAVRIYERLTTREPQNTPGDTPPVVRLWSQGKVSDTAVASHAAEGSLSMHLADMLDQAARDLRSNTLHALKPDSVPRDFVPLVGTRDASACHDFYVAVMHAAQIALGDLSSFGQERFDVGPSPNADAPLPWGDHDARVKGRRFRLVADEVFGLGTAHIDANGVLDVVIEEGRNSFRRRRCNKVVTSVAKGYSEDPAWLLERTPGTSDVIDVRAGGTVAFQLHDVDGRYAGVLAGTCARTSPETSYLKAETKAQHEASRTKEGDFLRYMVRTPSLAALPVPPKPRATNTPTGWAKDPRVLGQTFRLVDGDYPKRVGDAVLEGGRRLFVHLDTGVAYLNEVAERGPFTRVWQLRATDYGYSVGTDGAPLCELHVAREHVEPVLSEVPDKPPLSDLVAAATELGRVTAILADVVARLDRLEAALPLAVDLSQLPPPPRV